MFSGWMLLGLFLLLLHPGSLVLWLAAPFVVLPLLAFHWLVQPR
ncbi:MAG TPA: hypothetical protein VLK85_20035 [Ramlibacter sp.]|nr:hypothetical protein [Ramlibacter sp.]